MRRDGLAVVDRDRPLPDTLGIEDGGIDLERPAGCQPVVDDAGDQRSIRLEAGFPLDQGSDRDDLEGIELAQGGLALARVGPLVVEVAELECDQVFGRAGAWHQVGVREEKTLQGSARRQVLEEVVVELSLYGQRRIVAALDQTARVEQGR